MRTKKYLTPEEHLRLQDDRLDRDRGQLPADPLLRDRMFRMKLIDTHELDLVIPLCTEEHKPIDMGKLRLARVGKFFRRLLGAN